MFTPHFDPTHKVQECSHTSGSWTVWLWNTQYRVVANHIHTLTVSISDGGKQVPRDMGMWYAAYYDEIMTGLLVPSCLWIPVNNVMCLQALFPTL